MTGGHHPLMSAEAAAHFGALFQADVPTPDIAAIMAREFATVLTPGQIRKFASRHGFRRTSNHRAPNAPAARIPYRRKYTDEMMAWFEHLWCETETGISEIERQFSARFFPVTRKSLAGIANKSGWRRPEAMGAAFRSRLVQQTDDMARVALRAFQAPLVPVSRDRVRRTGERYPVPLGGYRMGMTG